MKKIKQISALLIAVSLVALLAAPLNAGNEEKTPVNRTPLRDGTYLTEGWGHNPRRPIKVQTTILDNAIVDIRIIDHMEFVKAAAADLIPRIIETQAIAADSVTGATISSNGIREAVAAAIDKAGGNSAEWRQAP